MNKQEKGSFVIKVSKLGNIQTACEMWNPATHVFAKLTWPRNLPHPDRLCCVGNKGLLYLIT